ncbi:rod shape determining protein MreC [Alcanivorax hongdengensis A-11-3]|uniref:Cell shape-determining protein MreC n=1 Tax=Alcanivorax hongdengensis A-11-3 TaxID=1177179 RepID=L0WB08_9GAMM|nr:rod shape-determining protein MreC [Alcanivorax hongdengensis]EKF74161.1 rod shape determining protein MreC [Alcanivorax hongdengensis A-11-3]
MVAPANPSYRLLIALILAVVLMVLDQRTPWAKPVRYWLGYLTAPVHYLAHLPVDTGEWLSEQTQSRSDLISDNNHLKRQVLILEQKVQRLAVLEAENVRLRELLNSSADLGANVLVAEIIGVDPDPNRQEMIINKGAGDAVAEGQAVLDAQGLIGQVISAGPLSARVLLITDASHAMSVQVNRNGVRAVLAGTGQSGLLRLLYVPDTTDIKVGDLLVSTGLGQRYPRGYPVARVTDISHRAGTPFAQITALPTAHIDRASHVLLVQPVDDDNAVLKPATGEEQP